MKLILIRHGRTDWNVQGRVQGRTDIPLDETGLRQAAAVARRLSGIHLNAIYTSPLRRAHDTAKAVAAFHSCDVHVAQQLTEINFGAWEVNWRRNMPRCGGIGTGSFIRKHAGRWERNPQMIFYCARFALCRKSFRRTQQKQPLRWSATRCRSSCLRRI